MSPPRICGLVLAGGRGLRMGGVDKGLVELNGRPLVAHVIARLRPQVDALLINVDPARARYADFGYPLVPDRIAGYAGPLAGLDAGLQATDAPLLVTAPCDSPFLPLDLVARLAAARAAEDADLAVATAEGRLQPVFSLVSTRLRPQLAQYLAGGDRKIELWYERLRIVRVPFDDQPQALVNINTRTELAQHQQP